MSSLRGIVADEPMGAVSHKQRPNGLDRLMVHLQSKKKIAYLRDGKGSVLTDPHHAQVAISEHWAHTSSPNPSITRDKCDYYLRSLHMPALVGKPIPLLFHDPTKSLVGEAFKRHFLEASPSLNGLPFDPYKSFEDILKQYRSPKVRNISLMVRAHASSPRLQKHSGRPTSPISAPLRSSGYKRNFFRVSHFYKLSNCSC